MQFIAQRREGLRQPRIIVGFIDQVLGSGTLVIKPHQQLDTLSHVGHEHAVAVLGYRTVGIARPLPNFPRACGNPGQASGKTYPSPQVDTKTRNVRCIGLRRGLPAILLQLLQ